MTATLLATDTPPIAPLLVWVFAPYIETADPNLDYYNDYSQSRAEYERVFAALALPEVEAIVTGDPKGFRESQLLVMSPMEAWGLVK